MNKILNPFLLLLLCMFLFSCYDEKNNYGDNLVDSVFRNISVDSCTVTVTSTIIDSLETTGQGLALVGKYTHSLWGTVSACTYLPYSFPVYNTEADEVVRLDSLVLALSYGGYSIGDTMQPMRLTIHRLLEKVILNDNGYLYNKSSFAYDPEPIAACIFKPKPGNNERLEIRLPDELGEDMLIRLHNRDDILLDDRFEDYFNGLVILPDPNICQNIISFSVGDTASALILHYSIEDAITQEAECIIKPKTETQFYHIDHDRTGTIMEGFPTENVEVYSSELNNRGILFGGIGWYSCIGFPYLNEILQQGERVSIESAYLKIYPEPKTWSEFNPLPDSLYLYIIDENNVTVDVVTDYLGTKIQSGTLIKDDSFAENTYYYFDISTFLQEELGAFGKYKHNLQLVFDEETYTQTFHNLTFSDQEGKSPIVLQLTYKVYESY
ncbi:putative uncharacterized protein [Tannerella sp. CAG:118]|nr:putative uncharacterized protein [Tannerella sp. CAG:118]